ncbi:MAG: ABC transporter substrate-binding protein [Armatimonadota bacterium]
MCRLDMRRIVASIITLVIACCGAEATKYPLTVKDSQGKTVVIPQEPKRIVSLAPSNTEILFSLGLQSRVVGVTRFCNYPADAKKKPKVGDVNISVEKVISLKPDLVMAHGTLNDSTVRALESHKVRIVTLDPNTIDQVMRDILMVGRITNKERQASKIVEQISSTRSLIKRKLRGIKNKPKVLVAVQANPLWVAGTGTFVDEIITIAGGTNIASSGKPGFNPFFSEVAVAKNPDVIIVMTKGDKEVFSKGIWKRTAAVRHAQVHEVNPDLLVRPGPRLTDGMQMIARLLHPNVFNKR